MLDGQRNGRPNHTQSVEQAQPSARGAPSLSLPKGGGAIRGIGEKFAANPVTGTGAMTVPLATSPGRSGFGPQLSLSYDSGAGNGPFGIGWSLALPAITRKTDKGLPQYGDAEESDVFLLSGGEDLVTVLELQNGAWARESIERSIGGEAYVIYRYRPRIEGLFARIERWTRKQDGDTYWRSISKDNITTFYGKTGESRIADPQDPRRIFSWLTCESYDDKGNAILYEYLAENAAGVDLTQAHERNRSDIRRSAGRYLKRIRYGNTPSRLIQSDLAQLAWVFEVVFDYDDGHYQALPPDAQGREYAEATPAPSQAWSMRQDPFSSHRAGFEVRTYRLCRRVLMFHHFPDELAVPDYLVRATEFRYRETPIASFITSVAQSGYRRGQDGAYLKRSLPSLDFNYSEAIVQQEVREVDPESLANLPASVDGGRYQWLDLDGEGLQCVLAEQYDGWYYKRNISPLSSTFSPGSPTVSARFEPITEVASLPSFAQTAMPRHQFLDLAGDGQLDCLVLERPLAGFFERTEDQRWKAFTPLPSLPNVEWSDPNLRFTDLDGDGHADILITEHEALTWYPSLAEAGFGPAIRVPKPKDEDEGPAIIFADADQAIFLADMSGDGLTDIVRIRNGEVCYWPNLGYGRFGNKITMDASPWFDSQDLFDQRRIRLADIDGSGVTDIIYLAHDGVRLYFNQSGNRWSEPQALSIFPRVDDLDQVQALDLLCNGTACLVWTSAWPADARHSMRYVDLMGGKPHLLIGSRNNLGSETRVSYAPSTKFYLDDRAAGQPWVTRLPFPVHVVERVETYDWVSRNRFVTRYSYHHGFYDGIEREFRGFGRVDHYDTEELGALRESGVLPDATNIDAASYVPTVLTKTWFHTGAYFDEARISRHFEDEYWRESDLSEGLKGLSDAELEAMLLPDTMLPPDLDGVEMAEASRSLKGALLRQEVYALDGTDEADRPYTVSESNYTIKRLQPLSPNRHAVFFTHAREAIDFNYERKLFKVVGEDIVDSATTPATARNAFDPRVTHTVALEVDTYGNVLKSVAISYGRRFKDSDKLLTPDDRAKQSKSHVVSTETTYTNPILADDDCRSPLPADARTFELINVMPSGSTASITNLFGFDELAGKVAQAGDGTHDLLYEDDNAQGAAEAHPYRRLIEQVRTLYRKNDLSSALPLGSVESLALPFEGYKLAFVPGLLPIYRRGPDNLLPDPASVLRGGGYVLSDDKRTMGFFPASDPDGRWWIPSGNVFYSPGRTDTFVQELAQARPHFFLPRRFLDPFGNDGLLLYDGHDLLLLEVEDAVQNKVTVGDRLNENSIAGEPGRTTDGSIKSSNDYRTLQPALLTDANGNRSAVAFDGLGLVAGTAVMGKIGEQLGDTLDGFQADLTQNEIDQFLANPKSPSAAILTPAEIAELHANPNGTLAAILLGNATTRIVYDLGRFARAPSRPASPRPTCAATIARETHVSDLAPGQASKLQVSFGYSDGFGREIQMKMQAEPGPLVERGLPVDPRWVGSGWTIFNNKGKPVRQYEPFFDDTHDFKFGVQVGVSPVLFYDPVERVVATLHPNHTFEKGVFDPWRQKSYDVNDTVTLDPKTDDDVKEFFTRLPDADYLPTWYGLRTDPSLAASAASLWPEAKIRAGETAAAIKAAVHADTPTVAFFDTLGRPFLTISRNKFVRSGATLEEKYATRTELNIEGNQREVIDANDRIVIRYDYDMLGTRIHQVSMEAGERWILNDVAGQPIYAWDSRGHTFRTDYDQLRRPIAVNFNEANGPPLLVQQTIYGEGQGNAKNHRTRIYKVFDSAGVVMSDEYDFKGNLRHSSRIVADDYKKIYDWKNDTVQPSWEVFNSSSIFDALNRPISVTAPDASVYRPSFNEACLLETVDVSLRGAPTPTPFVTNIDYDAKGQRVLIEYGNQVKTEYAYDRTTFRLINLKTTRAANLNGLATQLFKEARTVQDLRYTYDPAGNITRIADDAVQVIFNNNQQVAPACSYVYDAVYRLIEATGREHIGQTGFQFNPPDGNYRDYPFVGVAQPNDLQAMRNFSERYEYDPVGNFEQMIHQATSGNWTRSYVYNEPSLIQPGKNSNRLSSTMIGSNNPMTEMYTYDAHGNMTSMPHLTLMQSDFRDQLNATSRQAVSDGTPETTYYVYDANGQRVRKVTERQNGTRKNERTYLGGFEVYREYDGSGATMTLERETLHIMDDKRRIALVETRTQGGEPGVPEQLIRRQFGNHLGSTSLELDDAGQTISYAEYYPYGSTSYQAGRSVAEVSLKRYRYTGMERDAESGLNYHRARYYVPWLGRWTSCDPSGVKDGVDLYEYVGSNPTDFIDPTGTDGRTPNVAQKERLERQTAKYEAHLAEIDALWPKN
jgi:RHS repeat-associated protein